MARDKEIGCSSKRCVGTALAIAVAFMSAYVSLRSTLTGEIGPRHFAAELTTHAREYAFLWIVALGIAVMIGLSLARRFDILERFASLDPLTLLANRRVFEERLLQELERTQRYAAPMAILIIDVDKLKALNDHGGHQNGDRAIGAVGEAIRRTCRSTDLAARWGGDEFVVLLPCTKSHEAETLARRINAVVSRVAPQRHCVSKVSVSIGVADTSILDATSTGDNAASALFAAADRALFCAKAAGRACVKVASETPSQNSSPLRFDSRGRKERVRTPRPAHAGCPAAESQQSEKPPARSSHIDGAKV